MFSKCSVSAHTNAKLEPGVHVKVEGKFAAEFLGSLDDSRVNRTGEARQRHGIDSIESMDGRVELAGSVMVVGRLGELLVLSCLR